MLYLLRNLSRGQITAEALRSRGLPPDICDPTRLVMCDTRGGVVVGTERHTGYHPDRQTWHDFGDVWIGWEDRPTPDTLRREKQVSGYDYTLGDGQVWTCPTLRVMGRYLNVPTRWGLGPDGGFQATPLPEYADDIDLASWIWDVRFGDEECTTEQAFDACCRLLAVNYNLCPRGVSALGLIDSTNYVAVFKAAVDGPAVEELLEQELATQAAMHDWHPEKKKKKYRRHLKFHAWVQGRNPDYRPSFGELFAAARGVAAPQPVAVVGIPRGK